MDQKMDPPQPRGIFRQLSPSCLRTRLSITRFPTQPLFRSVNATTQPLLRSVNTPTQPLLRSVNAPTQHLLRSVNAPTPPLLWSVNAPTQPLLRSVLPPPQAFVKVSFQPHKAFVNAVFNHTQALLIKRKFWSLREAFWFFHWNVRYYLVYLLFCSHAINVKLQGKSRVGGAEEAGR